VRRFLPLALEVTGLACLAVVGILFPPAGLAFVGVGLLALAYYLEGRA
jgi:hypothetical protein